MALLKGPEELRESDGVELKEGLPGERRLSALSSSTERITTHRLLTHHL